MLLLLMLLLLLLLLGLLLLLLLLLVLLMLLLLMLLLLGMLTVGLIIVHTLQFGFPCARLIRLVNNPPTSTLTIVVVGSVIIIQVEESVEFLVPLFLLVALLERRRLMGVQRVVPS